MDQIKIGKFIASCRKDQGMTQAVLLPALISYLAVAVLFRFLVDSPLRG